MTDQLLPPQLHYTEQHQWAAVMDSGHYRFGITDYAQGQLGDIIFVKRPDIGTEVEAGERFGEVTSLKATSEIYAPIAGTVVATNEDLVESPEFVNDDPYGTGWICEIRPREPVELGALLTASAYEALTSIG
jgi:glycine cleavage system H protein